MRSMSTTSITPHRFSRAQFYRRTRRPPQTGRFLLDRRAGINVYAGLSVAMAFVHLRPRYFAEIMANLLFWLGPDKLCFGSDYAIWSPKWLIEKFMAFELPEDLKQEYHVNLTFDIKRKILGENTARLYGIDIPAQTAKLSQDGIGLAR